MALKAQSYYVRIAHDIMVRWQARHPVLSGLVRHNAKTFDAERILLERIVAAVYDEMYLDVLQELGHHLHGDFIASYEQDKKLREEREIALLDSIQREQADYTASVIAESNARCVEQNKKDAEELRLWKIKMEVRMDAQVEAAVAKWLLENGGKKAVDAHPVQQYDPVVWSKKNFE